MSDTTFLPVLTGTNLSHDYINPGEALFVTLNMRNDGSAPTPTRYRFVLDMLYGHQRKLDNRQFNYRVTAGAFPATDMWEAGIKTSVTLRWEVPGQWSGTYHLRLSIQDENEDRVDFFVPGHGVVNSFEIGTVNASWNFGRPWVFENTKPVYREYEADTKLSSLENPQPPTPSVAPPYKEGGYVLSDSITVTLCQDSPRIIAIDGVPLRYASPEISIRRVSDNKCFALNPSAKCTSSNHKVNFICKGGGIYDCTVICDGIKTATFAINISLSGRVLSVYVSDISESEGYELLSVKYPTLVEMTDGYMLDFFGGGRLIPIDDATPIFFERPYDARNAAVLYNSNHMFIVESKHLDSQLITGVYSVNNCKTGFIGGGITCRIPAAKKGMGGIKVKNPPMFTIEAIKTQDQACDKADYWTTAAKLLRRGINPNPARHLYRDTYFYKQLSTWGPLPAKHYRNTDPHQLTQNLFNTVTFAQIAENVRKFSNLTDGTKQVMYVTGFQKHGFDNAYPYPYDTEPRCGSLDDLAKCLTDSRKYNTLTGLHDNADDISVMHLNDFPYVAQDAYGNPWHGWVWPAGPTYMVSFCPYVEKGGYAKRVKKMTDILPLADSYHLDVLTAETLRYDFNPQNPASAQDSYQAKMAVVAEWNKYGIDITSEMLTHPSVGHIGFALHTRMDRKDVFIPGESFIPLTHMVYHGIIGYSAPSRSIEDMLWGLLIGGQTFYEEDITGELCLSRFYIQNIPAMKLYDKTMTSFTHTDSRACAHYGDESYVTVDFAKGTYRVVVDGNLIGQDFTTFVPANSPGAYLAYAFDNKKVVYPRPTTWQGEGTIRAVILTEEGEGEELNDAPWLEDGNIILHIPAMKPVKLSFSPTSP